jgi:hypothetical protein
VNYPIGKDGRKKELITHTLALSKKVKYSPCCLFILWQETWAEAQPAASSEAWQEKLFNSWGSN